MRVYKRFTRRLLSSAIVAAVIGCFVGCNDRNYDIGSNFLPDGNEMTSGSLIFEGVDHEGRRIISTRPYYHDRINVANQYSGIIGSQYNSHLGKRWSGFYSQYIPAYGLDEEEIFGYEPILDSVIFTFSVGSYNGDTTRVNKFYVYEVLNDDFLGDFDNTNDDDYFEMTSEDAVKAFAQDGVLSSEPLFTFKFPDQANGVYLDTDHVRLDDITDAGANLMNRLMLTSGDYDYSIYNGKYVDFVKAFKGLYICPAEDTLLDTTKDEDGATYKISLSSSGFVFYARSKYEEDPTLIADTTMMSFLFLDTSIDITTAAATTVVRDYTSADFVKSEDNPTIEPTGEIVVEGMGGVVNEFTFEQALFEQFDEILAAGDGKYNNVFFNTAQLTLYNPYVTEYGSYTEDKDSPYLLNDMPSRLVLYNYYSSLFDEDGLFLETDTAADYNYSLESSGEMSNIGGYMSRSRGCYVINIPIQMQDFWNDYTEAKSENNGEPFTQEEWDAMEWNKLYLGPDLDNLFMLEYGILQGQADGENATPVRFQITYTLLKK